MLHLALSGGLRVSELVGLCLDEVEFDGRYVDLRVRGKGRRKRALTLWKSVGDAIRAWLAVRGEAPAPELFAHRDALMGEIVVQCWRRGLLREVGWRHRDSDDESRVEIGGDVALVPVEAVAAALATMPHLDVYDAGSKSIPCRNAAALRVK